MSKSQLLVAALENGTVIDHIPTDKLFDVVNMLGLQDLNTPVTIGNNLVSKKLGRKGIIKIADRFFTDKEVAKMAVIVPNIKLTTIRNYEVVGKKSITMPDHISGIVRCPNPKCITNHEPMTTRFNVVNKQEGTLLCQYCNKEIRREEIKLI